MRLVDASYLAVFGSRPSRSSDVLGSSFLAYLGFLRASEFMVPNLSSYSSSLHLSVQDLAVDSSSATSSLRIRIKGSKTDPSRKGSFHSHWPCKRPLYAVHAMMTFPTSRGYSSGPLFLFANGSLSPALFLQIGLGRS